MHGSGSALLLRIDVILTDPVNHRVLQLRPRASLPQCPQLHGLRERARLRTQGWQV
jgi:hypothetical protein